MKNRVMALAFAACFVTSLAFADNPSDAPLVIKDESATVTQQNNATHNRKHSHKKEEPVARQASSQKAEKNNPQAGQGNSGYPFTASK